MNLTITTQAYTLCGSGEGSGLVDADVIHDEFGIPYIPGKRIKGLLRESALEVCEVLDVPHKIVDDVFGVAGRNESGIDIRNCFIPEYGSIIQAVKAELQKRGSILSKERIISYFTDIRRQTAIGDDGTALDHSLRTYRVIKPYLAFTGQVTLSQLERRRIGLLYLAAINLARMGTRRNRGFGKISCTISTSEFSAANEAIDALRGIEADRIVEPAAAASRPVEAGAEPPILDSPLGQLRCTIRTLSSVVFGKQKGDQNTVNCEDYIPGNAVRGILATRYIRARSLAIPYQDNHFDQMFLKGKITFSPAYLVSQGKVFHPAPLALRVQKGSSSDKVTNVFRESLEGKAKTIQDLVAIDKSNVAVQPARKALSFHSARDRIKGRSTGKNIFYYESLDPGQEFSAHIVGPASLLFNLKQALGGRFEANSGKSKGTQYGNLEVSVGDLEQIADPVSSSRTRSFIMNAISPIILHNDHGFPDMSLDQLARYLSAALGSTVRVTRAEVRDDFVETYVTVWHSKSQREHAFSAGSTFEVELEEDGGDILVDELLHRLELEGIGEQKEFGFGHVGINWISEGSYTEGRVLPVESVSDSVPHSPEFSKILDAVVNSAVAESLENAAYEKARYSKYRRISGHLSSKLEGIIKETRNRNDFVGRLDRMEGKTAWKTLDSIGLWRELEDFFVSDQIEKVKRDLAEGVVGTLPTLDREKLSRTYWLYFFRSVRKINKETGDGRN